MDKGIGFNRNIRLAWLDAAAAFGAEMDDPAAIRQRLRPIIEQDVKSKTNVRKSIDILLHIWGNNEERGATLRQAAWQYFQASTVLSDRLWLHYGLTMAVFPFFWQAVTAVGQLSRYEERITTTAVRERLFAELGELGSIREAVSRIVFSLRDWGVLVDADRGHGYLPQYRMFAASSQDLERWLLACALTAHPAEQLPFADLLHLPALFPFKFTVGVYDLRERDGFEVQRQGLGLDMVRAV